jgi:O-antigen/teichoic acid export membrane protein
VVLLFLFTKFKYKPELKINLGVLKKYLSYNTGLYLAALFWNLPIYILPLLITKLLYPEMAAYFYMDMMIATLLFTIPQATTQSLFAEGSHDENQIRDHLRKSIRIILILLIPACIFMLFFGYHVLLMFGKDYALQGFTLLQILTVSSILVSIVHIVTAIYSIKKRVREIVTANFIGSFLILSLSILLMQKGLVGIGIAWITGNLAMCLILLKDFRTAI